MRIARLSLLSFAALPLLAGAAKPPVVIDGLPIGALPPQTLPASGCAAYLFTVGRTRALAAVATPAQLRLVVEGRTLDLPLVDDAGTGTFALPTRATYRADTAVTATLDLEVAEQRSLTKGGVVKEATLTIDRPGRDSVVVPLAGLVGCT